MKNNNNSFRIITVFHLGIVGCVIPFVWIFFCMTWNHFHSDKIPVHVASAPENIPPDNQNERLDTLPKQNDREQELHNTIGGNYYNQLVAFLQPQWNAVSPSDIELGGKVTNWPIVDFLIEKDGRVVCSFVVNKSGNKAVDDAVTTFLENLKIVPAPPQTAVCRVTLEHSRG